MIKHLKQRIVPIGTASILFALSVGCSLARSAPDNTDAPTARYDRESLAFMNRAELVAAIAERANVSVGVADTMLSALVTVIYDALRGGDSVQITGFGTFQARDRAARRGRDPRSGRSVLIPAARVPAFRPGQMFKDALNRPPSDTIGPLRR